MLMVRMRKDSKGYKNFILSLNSVQPRSVCFEVFKISNIHMMAINLSHILFL